MTQHIFVPSSVHMLENICGIRSWKQNLWVLIVMNIELGVLSSCGVLDGVSVAHGSDSWKPTE